MWWSESVCVCCVRAYKKQKQTFGIWKLVYVYYLSVNMTCYKILKTLFTLSKHTPGALCTTLHGPLKARSACLRFRLTTLPYGAELRVFVCIFNFLLSVSM